MVNLEANFQFNYENSSIDFNFSKINFNTPITGVFGHTGSGKTTLLECIIGINNINSGYIKLNDNDLVSDIKDTVVGHRGISYLAQHTYLFPHLTVFQNIIYPLGKKGQLDYANQLISMLSLSSLLSFYPNQLSGGQQRQVALVRALIAPHKILILDEPLSGIDKAAAVKINKIIKKHSGSLDKNVLYVSHNIYDLAKISNEILVIDNGANKYKDSTKSLLLNSEFSIAYLSEPISVLDSPTQVTNHGRGVNLFFNKIKVTAPNINDPNEANLIINSTDVSISLDKVDNTSISNQFPVTVIDIIDFPKHNSKLVILKSNEFILQSLITTNSLNLLELVVGEKVWCLFKASSLIS
jgi:molybdate transport system ATP-binding protein